MHIVIDIPREIISDAKECFYIKDEDREVVERAVINGTILPEGHGRIGDLDQILIWMIYRKGIIDKLKCGEVAPVFRDATIIEADKTGSEEV